MKLTRSKLKQMLDLLPDFRSYENEYFEFQVHQTEDVIFTLAKSPAGIPTYIVRFVKNHLIGDWEVETK